MKTGIKYALMAATMLAATGASAAGQTGIVGSAQQRLNHLGYYAGPVDGVLGTKTRMAVMSFQRANGLAETGTLNPETYSLMGDAFDVRFNTAYYGYGNAYDYRHARAAYGYAPYYQQTAWDRVGYGAYGWQNAYNYGNTRALPVRFGLVEVTSNGVAGATDYIVRLNGQTILQANNQPQPLGVSRVHQMGAEDAIIFTAYDGSGGCSYKNYLITVKSDGTYLPAQQVGDCNGRYEANVDGNMLFVSFPSDYANAGRADTWRYSNNALVRL